MGEAQIERRKMVTLPHEEFEESLERAAERGARHALHEVGLDGEDAAHDIRELRNLLDAGEVPAAVSNAAQDRLQRFEEAVQTLHEALIGTPEATVEPVSTRPHLTLCA